MGSIFLIITKYMFVPMTKPLVMHNALQIHRKKNVPEPQYLIASFRHEHLYVWKYCQIQSHSESCQCYKLLHRHIPLHNDLVMENPCLPARSRSSTTPSYTLGSQYCSSSKGRLLQSSKITCINHPSSPIWQQPVLMRWPCSGLHSNRVLADINNQLCGFLI